MDTTTETSLPVANGLPALNIDQMLGSLGAKTDVAVPPSSITTTLNIDTLAKPLPIVTSSPSDTQQIAHSYQFMFLKKLGAFLLTVILLCGSYWFMSVQYPVEFEDYTTKVLGFFQTTFSVISSNITPASGDVASSKDMMHAVASEEVVQDSYADTPTPLTDSLAQAQGFTGTITGAEKVFDEALQSTGSSDTIDSGGVGESNELTGGTYSGSHLNNVLGGAVSVGNDDLAKKQSLREYLILQKQKADTYIAQGAGTALPLKLSIARAVSKKSESLSADLEMSGADLDVIDQGAQQLKVLLQRLEN